MTEWIKCSERMPETWADVLFSTELGRVYFGRWSEITRRWIGHMLSIGPHQVLAWMPLPKPYQPEKEREAK